MLRRIIVVLTLSLLSCKGDEPKTINFLGMGTTCNITVYTKTVDLNLPKNMVLDFEKDVSNKIETSIVSNINRNAGIKSIEANKDILELINKSLYYSELSEGYFDITISPLVELWDIGHSNNIPPIETISKTQKLINFKKVLVNGSFVKLEDIGMKIDLGGIAKGYAGDLIRNYLLNNGVKNAIINLGGNITVIGARINGEPWRVGIQDPRANRGSYLGILHVANVSVVTSGDYERFFIDNGVRYHHILDPFTGKPKTGEIISSTIITENGIDGDGLSTITFGMSLKDGIRVLTDTGVSGIFITSNSEIYISNDIRENFTLSNSGYRLIE